MTTVDTTEYLYGTYTGEDGDGYIRTWRVSFRITKKTPPRIYYARDTHPDGRPRRLGYVDRQAMEASGDEGLWRKSAGWWEPDCHLFLKPPLLPHERLAAEVKADVDRLRREAADAHPDRGGSDEGFIDAHRQLTAARARLARVERAA